MNKEEYEEFITDIPDFPKPGVVFKDINPLLKYKLGDIIHDMSKNVNWNHVDYVVGIESRGFILGSAIALCMDVGFIPIRKKGKLPPPVYFKDYDLEYGTDTLEMVVSGAGGNILLVDDVIATGGTLNAAIDLCEDNGFNIEAVSVLINLKHLNDIRECGYHMPVHSVLEYDEDGLV